VHAGNLTAKYQFEDGWLHGAYVGGWLHAQSETQGVIASDWHYQVRIPSLAQLTGFVGYARGKFDIRADIDNMTNRHGYVMSNTFQPQAPLSAY